MLHLISFTLQSLESIYNYLHILVQFTNVVFPDVEDMGIIDHPEDATNYGITDPNVGHMGSFNMQRDSDYVAWASTQRLLSSITFLSAVIPAVPLFINRF